MVDLNAVEVIGSFIMRAIISLIVVLVSAVMLSRDPSSALWITLISTQAGLWWPTATGGVANAVQALRAPVQAADAPPPLAPIPQAPHVA